MSAASGLPAQWKRLAIATAVAALVSGCISVATAQSSTSNGGTPVGAHQPTGCTAARGTTVTNGSRSGREVALTFDDGPSLTQTPAILSTLDRLDAKATFFEEGRHVAGREALMEEILAGGDEIGNHSFHHPTYPDYEELASTQRSIADATGFTPCLFRPPYRLINGTVDSAARRAHLETILWDVDSYDDHHPGVSAIRARTLSLVQPGSIVLMHDGGRHPQTVRALPSIIRNLRSRGYRLVTVTELLGGRFVFSSKR
jgi:peptidoglycan/xylan/chitin deacetylase (PgdA/CDA1 family)